MPPLTDDRIAAPRPWQERLLLRLCAFAVPLFLLLAADDVARGNYWEALADAGTAAEVALATAMTFALLALVDRWRDWAVAQCREQEKEGS